MKPEEMGGVGCSALLGVFVSGSACYRFDLFGWNKSALLKPILLPLNLGALLFDK